MIIWESSTFWNGVDLGAQRKMKSWLVTGPEKLNCVSKE